MSVERGFFLVKPDTMLNGGCQEAEERIKNEGLSVVERGAKTLTVEQVRRLYPERINSRWGECLLDYMTAGSCVGIVIEGEDCSKRLKKIKGETWGEGLRGKYSDNFIHNSFHSSDNQEKAKKEINIFFKTEND